MNKKFFIWENNNTNTYVKSNFNFIKNYIYIDKNDKSFSIARLEDTNFELLRTKEKVTHIKLFSIVKEAGWVCKRISLAELKDRTCDCCDLIWKNSEALTNHILDDYSDTLIETNHS